MPLQVIAKPTVTYSITAPFRSIDFPLFTEFMSGCMRCLNSDSAGANALVDSKRCAEPGGRSHTRRGIARRRAPQRSEGRAGPVFTLCISVDGSRAVRPAYGEERILKAPPAFPPAFRGSHPRPQMRCPLSR